MMTTQILYTSEFNNFCVQTIRKDFKKRSEVKVKTSKNYLLATIRFNKADIIYDHQYMNWENWNCCGGWAFDRDYLTHAVQSGRKLYAGIFADELPDLEEELEQLDLLYGIEGDQSWNAYICRRGCVADYINVGEVLRSYELLGLTFQYDELEYLKELVNTPIHIFSDPNNRFGLNYSEWGAPIEMVFVGMLLGYPIETTAAVLENY